MEEKISKLYLKPEAIVRFLLGKDENMDNIIILNSQDKPIMTTDQNLYEAVGSVRNKIDYNRLVKLLEVAEIMPHKIVHKKERKLLTHERAEKLMKEE